ncbi:MAG: hypothetical protein H0T64_02175 [Pyrinomonadaceae bacterium]|nr:hypothetical protein [Pyrinomonadaceae bacterium]
MDSDNEVHESTLRRLNQLRHPLLHLHKTLLDVEREAYERTHGRVDNSYEVLQLVMHDPWFAWLHSLSELVVRIDEMLDAKEPLTDSEAVAVIDQTRVLLTPSETGSGFQKKYFSSLQQSPDVVLAHSQVMTHLGAAGVIGNKNREDA